MIMPVQTDKLRQQRDNGVGEVRHTRPELGLTYLDLADLIGLEFWSAVVVDEPNASSELRRKYTPINQLRT